ncbi:Uncharacterised protein [Staphylococcus warneri]|nr:Uncharacterised protein [Staphylococcus warneri]
MIEIPLLGPDTIETLLPNTLIKHIINPQLINPMEGLT